MSVATGQVGDLAPARPSDLLRSEWTKLRSLNSTWVTLGVAVVLGIGISVAVCFAAQGHLNKSSTPTTEVTFAGIGIAQLALAVLGTLSITGEYASGTIRVSLTAVPRRGRMLAAKLAVLSVICVVAGEAIAFIAYLVGQSILRGHGPSASLGDPGQLRSVIGAGAYLALVALLGAGVGTLVRATAGAIAILVGFIFVLPAVATAIPDDVGSNIDKWWPTEAGEAIWGAGQSGYRLSPWAGFGDLVVFVAVLVAVAAVILRRRDA